MQDINSEMAEYFHSKKGFKRLLEALKEKYILLSRPSGTVIINNITEEESVDISNLLGKKINQGTSLKVSFKAISKKVEEGKFKGFDWILFLNAYFKENISTKNEIKRLKQDEKTNFFQQLYDKNKHRKYTDIVWEIIKNDVALNRLIMQKYNKNKLRLEEELENILKLLDNIPKVPTSLSVFSSVTGNPHFLDFNNSTSVLFLKVLAKIKKTEYEESNACKINLLSEINVCIDLISNFVITYKLRGTKILDELDNNDTVVNLNLLNINNIDNFTTKDKKVYIFENPSILATLMDLKIPIIITSGMPNLSLYTLLKKLSKNNIKMYYNGDFDPEGLLIAEKLKTMFPAITLICYDERDYNNAKSQKSITSSRLKKLEKIYTKDLQKIKELILQNNASGYQEQNIARIKEYIQKNIDK